MVMLDNVVISVIVDQTVFPMFGKLLTVNVILREVVVTTRNALLVPMVNLEKLIQVKDLNVTVDLASKMIKEDLIQQQIVKMLVNQQMMIAARLL